MVPNSTPMPAMLALPPSVRLMESPNQLRCDMNIHSEVAEAAMVELTWSS
jgi:hypothetical protein